MRPSNTLIQNILSSGQFTLVELYDITLPTGQTYHFTGGDVPLSGITVLTPQGSIGPFDYQAGLSILRGKLTQKVGTEAGNLEAIIAPMPNYPGGAPTIAGYQVQIAARYGFLDGARFSYNELYLNPAIGANTNAVGFFSGLVQEAQADRMMAHLAIDDYLAYLGRQQMPRPLFGTGCFHKIYDPGCTLKAANFTVAATVTSVGDASHFTASSLASRPSGYFNLGVVTFSGNITAALAGVSGPINSFAAGGFAMGNPFPVQPAVGDTFTAYPGCDLQQSTCSNSNSAVGPPFNNLAHFGGAPYTPQPLTLLDGGTDNPPAQTPGSTAGTVIGSQASSKWRYGKYQP